MDLLHDIPLSVLQFYLTAPYKCSYLEGREARSQVATPSFLVTSKIYSELVRRGFRRSGSFTYRPNCDACRACVPVRIPVNEFVPNRSQRRAARHHNGLEILLHGMKDNAEHFDLYRRYQKTRHRDDSMDSDDPVQYRNFLLQSHVDSTLVEFRDHGRLCMVSLIDILDDGLSSVYTFYDPATKGASFGTYNVLWQIELCRKLELDYLYLGYWIKESRKMAYKANFSPLQGLVDGEWKVLNGERA